MYSHHSLPRRNRAAHLGVCLILALSLGAAGAPEALSAAGESHAFNELSESAQQEETTPTQTTATTGSTAPASNSKKTIIIAMVAAVVVLVAIAFVIVRDARRVAPAVDGPVSESGSAHDSAATMRRRRAKAKAARQQRKRNR